MDDVVEFDFEVPQCSHCGVSLLTRDQPEASLVVAPDGCVLHWFCAYPRGLTGQRASPELPAVPVVARAPRRRLVAPPAGAPCGERCVGAPVRPRQW